MLLFLSQAAALVATLSEAAAVEACLAVLRGLFGDAAVPAPVSCHVTRWGDDEWARGSFCYASKGSFGPSDVEALRLDVSSKVFFAGDATSLYYPGKAHGAYLSGVDAARHVESALRPVKRHPDTLIVPAAAAANGHGAAANGHAAAALASSLARTAATECAFCHLTASSAALDDGSGFGDGAGGLGDLAGPFKDPDQTKDPSTKPTTSSVFWAHEQCALACPEVSQDTSGQWFNVFLAQKRGRQIGCSHCGKRGATVRAALLCGRRRCCSQNQPHTKA